MKRRGTRLYQILRDGQPFTRVLERACGKARPRDRVKLARTIIDTEAMQEAQTLPCLPVHVFVHRSS
jgi:hypothetical protein